MRQRKLLIVPGLTVAVFGCSAESEDTALRRLDLGHETLDSAGRPFGSEAVAVLASNSEQPGLLARLGIGAAGLLEFYEVEAGLIAISGAGRFSTDELLLPPGEISSSDIGLVWDLNAAGALKPPSLEAAIKRSEELVEREPGTSTGGGDVTANGGAGAETRKRGSFEIGQLQQAYVGGYCDTQYHSVNVAPLNRPAGECGAGGPWAWLECLDNWGGGRTITGPGTWRFYGNSCGKIGSHVFGVSWGSYGGSWSVAEEAGRFWYLPGQFTREHTVTMTITDALGDTFHHRAYISNN